MQRDNHCPEFQFTMITSALLKLVNENTSYPSALLHVNVFLIRHRYDRRYLLQGLRQ
jgi:hypothetical protein